MIPTFTSDYYENIWGTVHRHDYVKDMAKYLIIKYGQVRILDIGTGCGALVAALREEGADAWGLEISDYALANSCAPEFVRKGDMRNIPWASNSFDVVFSQGVWGYFPEEDVPRAWKECQRVGNIQHHHIDYDDYEPTHQYGYQHPKEWWDNQFYPKILVACPNHVCKEYAFEQWIINIKGLTYPNFDILVVDNSPDDTFLERWQNKIPTRDKLPPPMVRIDTEGIEDLTVKRINLSYEKIRKTFLDSEYHKLMIIESDVIPPSEIIEFMLERGGDTDWTSHAYPMRGGTEDAQQGIGCSMFSRRIMEAFDFESFGDNMTSDGGLWQKVRPDGRFTTMELWGYLKVAHLKEPN